MSDPTWISVLPPVLAIVLAIWTRQVYLSLAGGSWLAYTCLLYTSPSPRDGLLSRMPSSA